MLQITTLLALFSVSTNAYLAPSFSTLKSLVSLRLSSSSEDPNSSVSVAEGDVAPPAASSSDFEDELAMLSAQSAQEAAKPKFENPAMEKIRRAPRQAGWFPLLLAPTQLDGSMGGDVGFDPLGLSAGRGRLQFMRDAEVKHAR